MELNLYKIDKISEKYKNIYKTFCILVSLFLVHLALINIALEFNLLFGIYFFVAITAIVLSLFFLVKDKSILEIKINRQIIESTPIVKINNDYSLTITQNSKTIYIDNITSIVYSKKKYFHINCDINDEEGRFINNQYYFSTYMIDKESFIKILEFNQSITEMKSHKNFLIKSILNMNGSYKTDLFLSEIVTSKLFIPIKLNSNYFVNSKESLFDIYIDSNLQTHLYTSYDEYINKFKNYDKLILISFYELVELYKEYRNSILTEDLYIIINKDTENFKFEFKYLQELSKILEGNYGSYWN